MLGLFLASLGAGCDGSPPVTPLPVPTAPPTATLPPTAVPTLIPTTPPTFTPTAAPTRPPLVIPTDTPGPLATPTRAKIALTRVVFGRTINQVSNIWKMNLDGSEMQQITHEARPGGTGEVCVSPDGRWIGYVNMDYGKPKEEKYSLKLIRLDGTAARVLVEYVSVSIWGLAWSPDSRQIAFSLHDYRNMDKLDRGIWSVDVASGEQRLLVPGTGQMTPDGFPWAYSHPVWSPDGATIAIGGVYVTESRMYNAYVVSSAGGAVKLLKENALVLSWSPDGRRMLLQQGLNRYWPGLWVTTRDGTDGQRLTPDGWGGKDGTWSPDGRQIVCLSGVIPGGFTGPVHLWIVNADGTGRKALTSDDVYDEGEAGKCIWTPDGKTIVFNRYESEANRSSIWSIKPDGSGLRKLADDAWLCDVFVEQAP